MLNRWGLAAERGPTDSGASTATEQRSQAKGRIFLYAAELVVRLLPPGQV